jgi:hypothetical protein
MGATERSRPGQFSAAAAGSVVEAKSGGNTILGCELQ